MPNILLYKKVSENEVNTTNNFIKLTNEKLLQFEQLAYKILKEEYADDVMESDQNDSDIIFAYKQKILSNIRDGQNSKEMYKILNNKDYNKEVSNIIKNIISKIKEENNNKHSTINKES